MTRRPRQTALLAAAVAAGLLIGAILVQTWTSRSGRERGLGTHPHLELRAASAGALAAAGFRLSASAPLTWREIDLRLRSDDHGSDQFLACAIAAHEVDRLFRFAGGSWRSADDRPPAAWVQAASAAIPAWWTPAPARSRQHELHRDGLVTGLYAGYDPVGERLWLWSWTRRRPEPPPPRAPGLDRVSLRLAQAVQRAAPDADGWVHGAGLPDALTGTSADVALRARAGAHGILLRLAPLSASDAVDLLADLPMRRLDDDAAPPAWPQAAPGGVRPAWFAPGPGPRWISAHLRLGDGATLAARWAAYDRERRALYAWELAGP